MDVEPSISIDKYAFVPSHKLLVTQKVSCRVPRRFDANSVTEAVMFLLALEVLEPQLPGDIIAVIKHLILRPAPTTLALQVESKPFQAQSTMTVSQFSQTLKSKRFLKGSSFLVHLPKTGKPRLLQMDEACNAQIYDPKKVFLGTNIPYGHFAGWTEDPLTREELDWLNGRTIAEADIRDGDLIEHHYYLVRMNDLMRSRRPK